MKSKRLVKLTELLEDPIYKAWFRKVPPNHSPSERPWRVYAQRKRKGAWARKDFETYASAANFIIRNRAEFHNFALSSKVQQYAPPAIRRGKSVEPWARYSDDHRWCSFCRRPVIYNFFQSHHAMPNVPLDPREERCVICGARWTMTLNFMRRFAHR